MTKYEPEIQKRINRYEKKGYDLCSILEGCHDCGNGMHSNQKSPISIVSQLCIGMNLRLGFSQDLRFAKSFREASNNKEIENVVASHPRIYTQIHEYCAVEEKHNQDRWS